MKINHSKPYFTVDDKKSLLSTLESNFVTNGPLAEKLGAAVADFLGKQHGIATQSGTDALTAVLTAMDLPAGAEVALPAYICSAPLDALAVSGLTPVPVDIDRDTMGISVDAVNSLNSISAVIAAHLFGIPAPFYRIKCKNLIEDCAQTLGTGIDGHLVGSMGRFAVCSFYGTKLLTTGHGGLAAVNDKKINDEILNLLQHDNQEEWRPHLHFLMSDLNAALGLSQLAQLETMIELRREIACRFSHALDCDFQEKVNSVYSRFLVVCDEDLPACVKEFNRAGIEAKRPVYKPLFNYLGRDPEEFPDAQWVYDHIISVPIYPSMREDEIKYIEKYLENHKNALRCWPSA